jgi:phosphoglycerate dehydrogenase-like enzyme
METRVSRAAEGPIAVCLGYPAVLGDRFVERLRAIDPRVEPLRLPVDEGADWFNPPAEMPHDEPPPWAAGAAEARRDALSRAEVLIALHTPKGLLDLAPRLRWIQGIGAGVEQFAFAGVTRDRVTVTNASGVSAPSMAEFVIGRLLGVWKRFREADDCQRERRFVRTYGRTLAGSVLGIVGLGSIGCEVADRARALGMRVLGLKRSARPGARSEHADALFAPDQLREMAALCDALVVAAPATPDTRHLIDAQVLAAMKPGSVLVNVARGSLVDEEAVVAALERGQISAAVLDVFEVEPLPRESPLWGRPDVYISAHSSVSVDRYIDDVFDLFADNVARYVAGEPLRNVVDMEALGFG